MTPIAIHSSLVQDLVSDVRNQSPPTLAAWRLNDSRLCNVLDTFAQQEQSLPATSLEEAYPITIKWFSSLNNILAQQEQQAGSEALFGGLSLSSNTVAGSMDDTRIITSVVLGGKWTESPQSISECLVDKLLHQNPVGPVQTVSRTPLLTSSNSPKSEVEYQHVALPQGLDQPGGEKEIVRILQQVKTAQHAQKNMFHIYFTLGQHVGKDPFRRNVQAAINLATALPQVFSDNMQHACKLILTGTDATLASTTEDVSVAFGDDDDDATYVVPKYKIGKGNYTYAMSKLAQYYILGHAVAQMANRPAPLVAHLGQMADILKTAVETMGDVGSYDPEEAPISMQDLDQISNQWHSYYAMQLEPHLVVVNGISICFTPLHARPWTQAALEKYGQDENGRKKYLLEQVIRRLKNAISVSHAANLHLQAARKT